MINYYYLTISIGLGWFLSDILLTVVRWLVIWLTFKFTAPKRKKQMDDLLKVYEQMAFRQQAAQGVDNDLDDDHAAERKEWKH